MNWGRVSMHRMGLGCVKVVFSRRLSDLGFVPDFRVHAVTSLFSPAREKVANRSDQREQNLDKHG